MARFSFPLDGFSSPALGRANLIAHAADKLHDIQTKDLAKVHQFDDVYPAGATFDGADGLLGHAPSLGDGLLG